MKSDKLTQVTPVIFCGGSGTRLWPLSRTGFPKQFLCLTGKESLFQQAALRLVNLGNEDIQVASPIIVAGGDHRFLASEQLREIGVELGCALLEPVGRKTAPALTEATWNGRTVDYTFVRPGKAEFAALLSDSVEQAVMGRYPGSKSPIKISPLDAGWTDLGARDIVWNFPPKDAQSKVHVSGVLTENQSTNNPLSEVRRPANPGSIPLEIIEVQPGGYLGADIGRFEDTYGRAQS